MRMIYGSLNDLFWYTAIEFTNFSKVNAVNYSSGLLMPFFAKYMLGDKIVKAHLVAIAFAFTGMLMMVKPFK